MFAIFFVFGGHTMSLWGLLMRARKITKSRNHAITGGGGSVINVIKCDKVVVGGA